MEKLKNAVERSRVENEGARKRLEKRVERLEAEKVKQEKEEGGGGSINGRNRQKN